MKKYLDKNGLQDYTRKLTQKYKTMFSSPLIATTAAEMTDINKVYVYTGSESGYINGNWYYYNGTNWESGGIYNAVAVETDDTLSVAGKAADAKAAGDAIREITDGERTYNKNEVLALEHISDDTLYYVNGVTFGKTTLSEIRTTGGSEHSSAIKIPLMGAKTITFPVFKTSSSLGSFIFDENDIVLWAYAETTAETGTEKTIVVPSGASYMLLSISGRLYSIDGWFVNVTTANIKDMSNTIIQIENDVNLIKGKTINKKDANETYQKHNNNKVYLIPNIVVGTTTEQDAPTYAITGAYALKIPLDDVASISYPVFYSSSNGGSIICDSNDVIIWAYAEKEATTGTNKLINVPSNASYMMLQLSPSLASLDWKIVLYGIQQIHDDGETQDVITPFKDENRNMCLAGIKTDILNNKIPYHRGYLFHKLQNNDNSLWYGTDFKNINKIGSVTFDPTLMRFAISPKDGRIIAVQRDTRNGIWIWDGQNETYINSFASNPQAWLYNSGVDFINDANGNEYCVFAEYSSSVVSGYTLNVWRGKYPYTSASNWEVVFTQDQITDITHFHMIRRDPWTNILYLTAGDSSAESKWWYSTDFGSTWTLLISGTDTGWGNSLCRTINFIFTENYIYWATDHGQSGSEHHTLNRIARDSGDGVMDLTTKEQLTLLPQLYATNSLCYVESPNGLFMYDRIDVSSSSVFGQPIKMLFWDFATEKLVEIVSLKLTVNNWGGSRGKCYINYTNSKQPLPAMGFSIDTPCIFDLVCDVPSNIGTIAYEVGAKTVHTVDY